MDPLEKAARNIIEVCLGVKSGDRVLVIGDLENNEIGEKIYEVSRSITESKYIKLEEFGERPLKSFKDSFKNVIDSFNPTASVFVAITKEGEVKMRQGLIKHLVYELKVRHAHMPGVNKKIMLTGMQADYLKVREITMKVWDIVKDAKEIRVETPLGTELYVELGYKWIPDTGIIHEQGSWGNLPAGEVFTAPKNIEGVVYIDGCLGDYFQKYGKLKKPVKVIIEKGIVTKIKSENKEIEKELVKYVLEGPENSDRVGEFAIGTNIYLKEIIGNLLQDEKFPGIHIAFGDPYPELTGAPWKSEVHLDGVVTLTDIWVDDKKIMENGKFKI